MLKTNHYTEINAKFNAEGLSGLTDEERVIWAAGCGELDEVVLDALRSLTFADDPADDVTWDDLRAMYRSRDEDAEIIGTAEIAAICRKALAQTEAGKPSALRDEAIAAMRDVIDTLAAYDGGDLDPAELAAEYREWKLEGENA